MKRKLGPDAFAFYAQLGPTRSYGAVAERFEVSKQTVVRAARRENWQGRLTEIEAKARERTDESAAESIEEMNQRHTKFLRAIQARALEALKSMPLSSAMEAVRALELTIKHERLINGEPSERAELSVEDVTREEIATCLKLKESVEEVARA